MPGLGPHPRHAQDPGFVHPADPEDAVQLALDCISLRYPWTAHELLEARWLAVRPSPEATALQGLLQVAASGLLSHLGRTAAARRVRERAARRLRDSIEELARLDVDGVRLLGDLDAGVQWPVLECIAP